jgi:hypothetical protein
LNERDQFLVIASDGLWETFSSDEVVQLVKKFTLSKRVAATSSASSSAMVSALAGAAGAAGAAAGGAEVAEDAEGVGGGSEGGSAGSSGGPGNNLAGAEAEAETASDYLLQCALQTLAKRAGMSLNQLCARRKGSRRSVHDDISIQVVFFPTAQPAGSGEVSGHTGGMVDGAEAGMVDGSEAMTGDVTGHDGIGGCSAGSPPRRIIRSSGRAADTCFSGSKAAGNRSSSRLRPMQEFKPFRQQAQGVKGVRKGVQKRQKFSSALPNAAKSSGKRKVGDTVSASGDGGGDGDCGERQKKAKVVIRGEVEVRGAGGGGSNVYAGRTMPQGESLAVEKDARDEDVGNGVQKSVEDVGNGVPKSVEDVGNGVQKTVIRIDIDTDGNGTCNGTDGSDDDDRETPPMLLETGGMGGGMGGAPVDAGTTSISVSASTAISTSASTSSSTSVSQSPSW